MIILGQHKSDINRLIQLNNVIWAQFRYIGTNIIWLHYAADSIIRDPIKRRSLYMFLSLVLDRNTPSNHFPFFKFYFIVQTESRAMVFW
jgi:hypothetical protein